MTTEEFQQLEAIATEAREAHGELMQELDDAIAKVSIAGQRLDAIMARAKGMGIRSDLACIIDTEMMQSAIKRLKYRIDFAYSVKL
jgi:hypothetical protein